MFKSMFFLASAIALVLADEEQQNPVVEKATVRLEGPGVNGNITLTQLPDGKVHITGRIVGMAAGNYGFHIHEKGDITTGCGGTLGHYNPHNKDHGHPSDENRHAGDLGNVKFDENQVSIVDIVDHLVKLSGPHNVIGRGLVLHSGEDDYGKTDHPLSKKTGNAGDRVACGVIGIA